MSKIHKNIEGKRDSFWFPIGLFIMVLMLWGGTWIGAFKYIDNWSHRGQFGDIFGSINALFSGLAFAGIIYTIYQQRKELELQREELQLQRQEMAASRAELKNQVKAQEDQVAAIKFTNQVNISQIKVAANQARIEIIKIQIIDKNWDLQQELIKDMEKIANDIEKYAEELEELQ